MTNDHPAKPWTPESLSSLATAYWQSQALLAAVETNLFDTLPATASEAAAKATTDPRLTLQLLEALTSLGLLIQTQDTFDLVPSARRYLTSTSPTSLLPALRFNTQMYQLWAHLPTTLKSGQPASPPTAHLGSDPNRTKHFVLGMHSRALALMPGVIPALDLSNITTLLDVGSGPGTLSRLLCEKYPKLRATCLDLPAITDAARALTASHPMASRITHLSANYLSAPLPDRYDAILYCGALHQHSPAQAQQLIQKLAQSLNPGGTLHIIDFFTPPTRTAPEALFPLLFALNMSLLSPASHTHSIAEVTTYLTQSNLTHITPFPTPGGLYTLISAQR